METIDPIEYLKNLEIKGLKASFPVSKDAGLVEEATKTEQSFLNARSLVSFVSEVSGQQRSDVLNSVLLAQLAANKQFSSDDQSVEWYEAFVAILNNTGWAIENSEFSHFESSDNVFDIENVIIDILTAAFGGTFIGVITNTLNAIKGLSDSNGTITAFEKNTHSLSKGTFQIGIATVENGAVALQLGTFLLTSSNEIKRILFFKSTKDKTTLDYCSRKGTLNEEVYGIIRTSVQTKLGKKADEFITEIEL